MRRYTVMLFQEAYPEQIRIDRHIKMRKRVKSILNAICLMKIRHRTCCFSMEENFPDDEAIDKMVQKIIGN